MLGLLGMDRQKILRVSDGFNRTDSILTLGNAETGQPWTAVGTWGISSGRAYCVSDVNGDLVLLDTNVINAIITCITNGQLNGVNTNYPYLAFHGLNSSDILTVRFYSGQLYLNKKDAGVNTTLAQTAMITTDNVDYLFKVTCRGTNIIVNVNGTDRLNYTLTGGDTKFAAYTKVGMMLARAGTPTITAKWDNFKVEVA